MMSEPVFIWTPILVLPPCKTPRQRKTCPSWSIRTWHDVIVSGPLPCCPPPPPLPRLRRHLGRSKAYSFIPSALCTRMLCRMLRSSMISSLPPGMA
ncbi:hypothetical protein CH063_14501 [Colletotrichum higginsianum]|uniref:Uncharacterized protein n=1 Tax=Colletotrichum higginsianum (strain IMI 349063) TaxID=759273 RepID=H1VYU8_COLHI|nr:hypothetical protein CH063_14501 [Colletotrichum higginsianum]